jgi:hypothetical protein
MTVRIIPITPAYRAGWEQTFGRGTGSGQSGFKDLREEARVMLREVAKNLLKNDTPGASPVLVSDQPHCASEIPGVFDKQPPTPLIAPDCIGRASSAPRGATKIYMTTPLPASWGMVDGRPF